MFLRSYLSRACVRQYLRNGPEVDLEITAECDGPEVKFTITNNGDDMTAPVNYIVIEDIMIQMNGNVQLNSGDSVINISC
ncbi:MAG: hypothetical protein R2788_10150 [Saprospiraceae bacterium]